MQAASAKAALKATKEGIKVVRAPACRQNKTGPWGAHMGRPRERSVKTRLPSFA